MEAKITYLVEWLRKQVEAANAKGLLVGISGGVDSAVVAYLIRQACPDSSLGIIMPCKSMNEDRSDALEVIANSGIEALEIDLTETHQKLFNTIQHQIEITGKWQTEAARLNDANLRARLRMATLYSVASNYGYLVVGTDNAAEWHTGYFTKYGDGGVDLVPLVHLTKGEVREMARLLGVPTTVIEKAPSAGLWQGQTDEAEMGITYEQIDRYLKGETIAASARLRIEQLHRQSEHKRRMATVPAWSFQ